ncbi:MAG TPA: saccharopine dehydrogenase NADP-binding domain-containing protein [Chitinophagales bacterium]|nr:saccharopine dehydrogenase NADP-binding domain-containing protein [Chitinophagales bacterium]
MKEAQRKYDIVIYGATGFTGQLVAEYFANNVDFKKTKWAIAGRDQNKLLSIKNKLTVRFPELLSLEHIIADTDQPDTLEALAKNTKVVITTVGPYQIYGEPIVKACVEAGTHCLDLTGEPKFVQHIYKHYNFLAERNHAFVINSCGFDSVPADMGAFYTAQLLGDSEDKSIQSYVSAKGSFSGGTLKSAIGAFEGFNEEMILDPKYKFGAEKFEGIHRQKSIQKWALPMPVVDPLIVERSSRLRKDIYGNNFSYAQYFAVKKPFVAATALVGLSALVLATQVPVLKNKILNFKQSGEGPSLKEREQSFFKLVFIGKSPNKTVETSVSGGDPGYTETAKMLSEAALTLIENPKEFSGKGGVSTPAGALGEKYLQRLIESGIQFKQLK